ncbi:hypothetical protein A4A49_01939 [Nicotiana attenuata]|uniref:DUF4283 domain-containing protein n=1 Tax=Nicotiana attenuata TaxID=49451 RepID=A0A1J6IP13_NICAT|nr:hypothetical protein A4A49_01939 [Nicotiana attenuata]
MLNSGESELAGHGAPMNQLDQNQCQLFSAPQEIVSSPSNIIVSDPISSNFKFGVPAHCSFTSVRPSFNPPSSLIPTTTFIGDHSLVLKENICQVSSQSTQEINSPGFLNPPVIAQLTRQGAVVNQVNQSQCNKVPAAKEAGPTPSLQNPIPPHPHSGSPAVPAIDAQAVPIIEHLSKGQLHANDVVPPTQQAHTQPNPTPNPNNKAPIKISSNFDRPNNPKKAHTPPLKNAALPVQPNKQAPSDINPPTNPNNNSTKNKPVLNTPPTPPTVTHSFVNRLRARHESEIQPISFTSPKITTKEGQSVVVFKKEDYMVRFANRCKFTCVGKFSNIMPRMEVIKKSFIAQTKVRGGVKIAHFNARTVYIDLDNDSGAQNQPKQQMYIQGQMMKLEAWTPAFKPNEDSPIVPTWVVIPELPWHLYYMEILTPLLSPIGKALYLDLTSFQKTRGSVAKVKIQIDLIKQRLVCLGYDEEQDENGDGEWLEVQYDNVPAYCIYCRHIGHSEFICEVRLMDEEKKKKKEEEIKAGNQKGPAKEVASTSKGDKEICLERPKSRQEGVPNGEGIPHVLHECASAHLSDHREDLTTPATTVQSVTVPANTNSTDPQIHNHATCESSSSDDELFQYQDANLRSLAKGKAQIVADFTLQTPKSKNNPSQKKRQAMRKQNKGISINEPSAYPIVPYGHQSPTATSGRKIALNSADRSQGYKDPDPDPSLSQPLLDTADQQNKKGNGSTIQHEDALINVMASTPIEECPLNNSSPELDEYRPLLSEDEMSGSIEEENEISDVPEDDEQHYDLLVEAVNGAYQHSDVIDTQGLSPRTFNPSPRITRSKAECDGTVIDHDEQQLTVKLGHVEAADPFHLTIIYAKCKIALRRPLWDTLRTKALATSTPWCVIGDFNVITSIEEKIGCIPYQINKSLEFISMIEDCGLTDLGYYGPRCTWSNGRGPCSIVWKRLHRGLVNDSWLASNPATTITHLASAGSDHSPLLMKLNVRTDNSIKYFKFLNCWTENDSFLPLVQEVWNIQVSGNPMWVFHQKLKALCSALYKWSRQQYGDIFLKAKEYKEKVRKAEETWAQSTWKQIE